MSQPLKKISKSEATREIYLCCRNPFHFIEKYCKVQHPEKGLVPFILYEYQKETITNLLSQDKLVINKARQLGISTVIAAYVAWLILFHKDKSVLIVSTKSNVAKNLLKKIKVMLKHIPNWMYLADIETNQAHMLGLSNGSSVKSVARSEDAGRSEALSLLIIDEAAHVRDLNELWKGLASTVAAGGKVIANSCVTEDTFVFTDKGIKKIKDFIPNEGIPGDYELSGYGVFGKDKIRKGQLFHNNGFVKTKKIHTVLSDLEGSFNHKLWACKAGKYDWFKLEDLNVGDWVNIKYGMNCWGNNDDVSSFRPIANSNIKYDFNPKTITPDIAYFIGLYISEGSVYKKYKNDKLLTANMTITCGDDIREATKNIGIHQSSHDGLHNTFSSVNLIKFFEYLGFDLSQHAHEKEIPGRIFEMSKKNVAAMLSGIFDGDGTSHSTRGNVAVCSTSKILVDQIRVLLLNFGITSRIYRRTVEQLNENCTFEYKFKHDCYTLEINCCNSKVFYDEIGFRFKRKQENLKNLPQQKKVDVIPFSANVLRDIVENSEISQYSLRHDYGVRFPNISTTESDDKSVHVTRERFTKILDVCKDKIESQKLDEIKNKMLIPNSEWIQIKSIEDGEALTYDFSLPDIKDDFWSHSVVYNGILGHQTPKGSEGWFYDYCKQAQSGESEWQYQEIPWWAHPDYAEGLVNDSTVPGGKTSPWFQRMTQGWTKQQISQELLTAFTETGDTYLEPETLKYYEETIKEPLEKTGPERGLWIWKTPEYKKTYIISSDVASGTAEDYTTAIVLDPREMEIVAEFRGKIQPDDWADYLNSELGPMYNNALIVPENNNVGMVTALGLKRLGYKNLAYFDEESGRLLDRWQAQYDSINPGFQTNVKSRPMIMAKMEEFMRKRVVKSYSRRLHNEFLTFAWINNKPQAKKHKNDDLILALAIAIWINETYFQHSSAVPEDIMAMYKAIKITQNAAPSIPGTGNNKAAENMKKIVENQKTFGDPTKLVNISWIYKA